MDSVLAVNTGAATDTTMTYNGGTPTSTLQDFTGTTGFNFSFTSIDHDPVPILITIEDSTGKTETATGSTDLHRFRRCDHSGQLLFQCTGF